ncbi:ATP-binding protein [Bacillus yapensis]|uniref:ATP-binding protein n=1 Tax=Bacillus yapensis TaxID=2492960 RepID=UPI0014856EC5|nr:ATP-binding protein [Bacillus yapensis]
MLIIEQCKTTTKEIEVKPSNNIFSELGNNNYNFIELISELIDNSISANIENKQLEIIIDIGISNNEKNSYLIIKDNGKGIKTVDLGRAISPAGFSGGTTLNEHGLGMKQAIASLGNLKYLVTKSNEVDKANYINKFEFGKLEVLEIEVPWESGTEICVENLKDLVPKSQQKITMVVVPYLSAKYRRFLNNGTSDVRIILNLLDIDELDNDGLPYLIQSWELKELKPIYFHPNQRNNKPIHLQKKFKGKGWEAKFTIGYAPTNEEYVELGMEPPKNYEPYNVSINKQGFDLIAHNRVINFTQFSELEFIKVPHHAYNYIRGEIDLVKGFKTSTTKNFVVRDKNFNELLAEINTFLETEKLLERKNDPTELPEHLLRDRLKHHLLTRKIEPKKDVKTEYVVEGLAGSIDILADKEAWEIKRGQASGLDVYQLFAYLDMGNIESGYLVAKSYTTGAETAVDFIKKNHSKEIILVPIDEFPINGPANSEERKKYFR